MYSLSFLNAGRFKEESGMIKEFEELNKYNVYFLEIASINERSCGKTDSSYFSINVQFFSEAQSYNSCLNKKISIDTEGNIKNCPSMKEHFGNTKTTSLQTALKNKKFKKYWDITKDKITVCKDCEFRYICLDCRAYLEDPDDLHSKPLKCGYDPYTGKWEEWNKNPLKEKTIKHYEL